MGPLAGNDNILDGESKYSKDSDFDFDRREKNFAMNGNKPPPQPATAAVNSIHWDVEEDHLLSYFLGANEGANGNAFDTIPESAVVDRNPIDIETTVPTRPASQPTTSSMPRHVQFMSRDSSGGYSSSSTMQPPTPAVQFYDGHHSHHHHHPAPNQGIAAPMPAHSVEYNSFIHPSQQVHRGHSSNSSLQERSSSAASLQQNRSSSQGSIRSQGSIQNVPSRTLSTTSSAGSNSSQSLTPLTSMAAAMALGGPNQVMYMQQRMQQKMQSRAQAQYAGVQMTNSSSPITPTYMLGSPSGQEMMMLPPPSRFPNNPGMMMEHPYSGMQQQHMVIPEEQQQQHSFLPQMGGPPTGAPMHHHPQSMHFPDPNSVTSAVLQHPQSSQQSHQQQQQAHTQPPQAQQQQIQIGLNGQTIPLKAIPGANGSVYYQIDPSAVPGASANPSTLRYFTKAINEVSKPDEKEIDPKVMAEKRQQRLARNRESARQSRRRKKEHLSNLATKVKGLQRQLEDEVRNKIKSMEGGLVRQRGQLVDRWLAEQGDQEVHQGGDNTRRDQLAPALRKTGPNCPIRRTVIAHQYNFLRQAFLSTHNHYSVWMMMQSSSFFTEANLRRQNNPTLGGKGSAGRTTAGSRANSKQVGEEIYNEETKRGNSSMVTCRAGDESRMWPLYCHEITMTMEQEDKIVNQAHREARNTPNLKAKLQKMKTATDATRHLQNAMMCHTQLASQRNETLLLDILTPAQTALFLEWLKKNKGRCKGLMEQQLRPSHASAAASAPAPGNAAEGQSTLGVVCRQLEEMRLQQK